MDDKRYAVLIDSDNISSKYISNILDEMTKYGVCLLYTSPSPRDA